MDTQNDKKDILHNSFGKSSDTANAPSHPHSGKIIEESRTLLQKSKTGAHLLKISDSYGFKLDVTPSPEDSPFRFMDGSTMIAAPAAQSSAGPRQALDLAAHLRDAEQGILGYKRNRADLSPEELEAQNHAKNLDIIVDLCRISVELEEEAPEVRNELFAMGYKDIFQAFKKNNGNDALLKAYEKMIEETKK